MTDLLHKEATRYPQIPKKNLYGPTKREIVGDSGSVYHGPCLDFPSLDERAAEVDELKRQAREQEWAEIKSRDEAIEAKRKQDIREFEAITRIGGVSRLDKGMGSYDKNSLFSQIEKGEK